MDQELRKFVSRLSGNDDSFWRNLIETMNEALVVVDTKRRIVFFNPKAEQLTGKSLEQVRGELCVNAISCPQCSCACRLFEDGQFEQREVEIYEPRNGRKRVFLKNGRLLHDPEGRVVGGVETFQDITGEVEERQANKRRVEQLFHERNRYQALLESLPEGVLAVDGELCVLHFSQRMSALTGYDRQQAEGSNLLNLFDIAYLRERLDTGEREIRLSCSLRTKSGNRLPVELLLRSLPYGSGERLLVVTPLQQGAGKLHETAEDFHGIITISPAMREMLRLVESAARSNSNVLIEGESGTGKELVARAMHQLGPRRDQPFYAVNCATFTGSLLLSELFGHERGAFTGAVARKAGKLELAGRGTLFLDEVAEIPLQHQALLLRVLEQRVFERVGGHQPIEMNARIVAATNRPLAQALAQGEFREDLYYRLKVLPIRIPPLRQRPEDIELLARTFLGRACREAGLAEKKFTEAALDVLRAYHWPGNVRELRNLVEYLVFAAGEVIGPADLPREIHDCPKNRAQPGECHEFEAAGGERLRIVRALEQSRWHRARAARLLGIDRSTLYRRMRRLGIKP